MPGYILPRLQVVQILAAQFQNAAVIIRTGSHTHNAPVQFVAHPAIIQEHQSFPSGFVVTGVQTNACIFQFVACRIVRKTRFTVTGIHPGPPVGSNTLVPAQQRSGTVVISAVFQVAPVLAKLQPDIIIRRFQQFQGNIQAPAAASV